MSKIYLIVGSSGSFDSYHEWNVRAYTDKKKAERAAKDLKKAVKAEVRAWRKWLRYPSKGRSLEEAAAYVEAVAERTGDHSWQDFDPDDGGEYSVEEVDLDE